MTRLQLLARQVKLRPSIDKSLQNHDAISGHIPFVVMTTLEHQIDTLMTSYHIGHASYCQSSEQGSRERMYLMLVGVYEAEREESRPYNHQ